MSDHQQDVPAAPKATGQQLFLFWGCFIALIATAFGFIIRTQIIGDWATQFNLSEIQRGELLGVGLWPFAISIVLFSLIIDRIGYGKAMIFAFVCHIASAIITILTPVLAGDSPQRAYWVLYIGTFVVALGNGTVEAVINPVVATLFPAQKTKWLNILHAGWPGGLVLGGIIAISMGGVDWRFKVALIFLPVIAYGVMMIFCKFPINERVAAGVSYRTMLQQVGFLGALIVVAMITRELSRVVTETTPLTVSLYVQLGIIGVLSLGFGIYTRSIGHPLFIFLLLIMLPLATTELGTDSWITSLMEPAMATVGINAGWVLVYTSAIMLVLRFFAGPIVHKLSPLGLLAASALIAVFGLIFLSKAAGIAILIAATLYGFGKTFFWPTMLGVVSEQFPKGGALTLNTIGGVGMLAVGVVGNPFFGVVQDNMIRTEVVEEFDNGEELYARISGETKESVFGAYTPIDDIKLLDEPQETQDEIASLRTSVNKETLMVVAIFPAVMFVCYLALIFYFRAKGGYKAEILVSEEEEGAIMAGGVVGPAEM